MLLGDDTLHEPRSQSAVSAPQGRRQTTVNSAPASSYTKQEEKHNDEGLTSKKQTESKSREKVVQKANTTID